MLNWQFSGIELHNLTLANGPVGHRHRQPRPERRDLKQKLTRPGTYRFFCSLHPVQMTQRVVVKRKKKKAGKKGASRLGRGPRAGSG